MTAFRPAAPAVAARTADVPQQLFLVSDIFLFDRRHLSVPTCTSRKLPRTAAVKDGRRPPKGFILDGGEHGSSLALSGGVKNALSASVHVDIPACGHVRITT
jgi:hypothetical protein